MWVKVFRFSIWEGLGWVKMRGLGELCIGYRFALEMIIYVRLCFVVIFILISFFVLSFNFIIYLFI